MSSLKKRWRFTRMYLGKPRWDTDIPVPELTAVLKNMPPGRGLDIGCGTGTNILEMIRHGWQAAGLDFSPLAILKARWRLFKAGKKAPLFTRDAAELPELPLNHTFDLALDVGCFHSLRGNDHAVQGYLDGLQKWLKPGGKFMLYAHEIRNQRSHGFSKMEIEEIFSKFLKLENFKQGMDSNRPSAWYYFARPIAE